MKESFITRIERSSSYSKRYQIYVDDETIFSIHEDILVKYHLYKGMSIDPTQIQELTSAEEQNQVRLAVLRYLSYRPRTEYEVHQYAIGKEFSQEYVSIVIIEMRKHGYLDDRAYANAWVAERRDSKGFGSHRLKRELKRKGVPVQWIEEALSHTDEEEERLKAMEVAERRYIRIHRDSWAKVERKLGQYLLRQGFSSDTVYSILHVFRSRHMMEEGNE